MRKCLVIGVVLLCSTPVFAGSSITTIANIGVNPSSSSVTITGTGTSKASVGGINSGFALGTSGTETFTTGPTGTNATQTFSLSVGAVVVSGIGAVGSAGSGGTATAGSH